jgi:hypothetical protein
MELCGLWWNIVDRFDVGLGFVIELNYAGFAINVYMCELVLLNHVNICGRILELTPKNGTNLSNFELTKKPPRLNQIPTPQRSAVLVLGMHWRDCFMSRARRLGATHEAVVPSDVVRLMKQSRL